MSANHRPPRFRLVYLFTTFPVLSETFYQREIRALAALAGTGALALEVHSLWRGSRSFEGVTVRRFRWYEFALLTWWLPYWTVRRPRVIGSTLRRMSASLPPSPVNLGETLVGLAFGLCGARRIERRAAAAAEPTLVHAAWATMPATAAHLICELTGVPFATGAHAYDVFRDGGDWWLDRKLTAASLVVTSTAATRAAILARGAPAERVALVRRGLDSVAESAAPRTNRTGLRLVCVARLVEKKGLFDQLEIYAALQRAGVDFTARIVGDGPLRRALAERCAALGLNGRVTFTGAMQDAAVRDEYRSADVFVYTGKMAADGDRDGLPNVIPEAMAAGLPIVSTATGGVEEAVTNDETGFILDAGDTDAWCAALAKLRDDDALYLRLRGNARDWVTREFDARRNAATLLERLREAAGWPAQ